MFDTNNFFQGIAKTAASVFRNGTLLSEIDENRKCDVAAGRASKASVARSTPPPARTGALNTQGQLLDELSGTGTRERVNLKRMLL